MHVMPRYQEWLLLTAGVSNRRADTVMKYLDSLIQRLERHPVAYNCFLTTCDLFFTADYWLKVNRGYTPAHASMEDLYRLAVKRLCELFHCSVNVLPRELELMFGREMSYDGFKTDLIQGRARSATRDEMNQYRVVFKAGKAHQFPHWEPHPTEALKPVDSAHMYQKNVGLKRDANDVHCVNFAYFVMTMGRDLYLRKHSLGREQKHDGNYHSNYTGGGAVLCAGSMLIEGGVIKTVRSDSGHYKPTEQNMVSLLLALQMHGVNIANVRVVNFRATQIALAPEFIEANGDWTKFVDQRNIAPMNNQAAFSSLQADLQNAPSNVAPHVPRTGRPVGLDTHFVGKNAHLPPNYPKAPPRPPRPGQMPMQAAQGRQMRSGRPLPPIPGQRGTPGYNVRVPQVEDLYQT